MKVIFLDFDGVLVTHQSFRRKTLGKRAKPTPEVISAMNYILAKTKAKIVVSSVWRLGRSTKWLQQVLDAWGIEGKIIGETPSLHQFQGNGLCLARPRGDEIQQWLRRHAEREPRKPEDDVESFVILDDDADMGDLLPFLVKTDFENGLTFEQAQRACKLLSSRTKVSRIVDIQGVEVCAQIGEQVDACI